MRFKITFYILPFLILCMGVDAQEIQKLQYGATFAGGYCFVKENNQGPISVFGSIYNHYIYESGVYATLRPLRRVGIHTSFLLSLEQYRYDYSFMDFNTVEESSGNIYDKGNNVNFSCKIPVALRFYTKSNFFIGIGAFMQLNSFSGLQNRVDYGPLFTVGCMGNRFGIDVTLDQIPRENGISFANFESIGNMPDPFLYFSRRSIKLNLNYKIHGKN